MSEKKLASDIWKRVRADHPEYKTPEPPIGYEIVTGGQLRPGDRVRNPSSREWTNIPTADKLVQFLAEGAEILPEYTGFDRVEGHFAVCRKIGAPKFNTGDLVEPVVLAALLEVPAPEGYEVIEDPEVELQDDFKCLGGDGRWYDVPNAVVFCASCYRSWGDPCAYVGNHVKVCQKVSG